MNDPNSKRNQLGNEAEATNETPIVSEVDLSQDDHQHDPSLDPHAEFVAHVSDDELANQFLVNNENALTNSEAVFTNIADLSHEKDLQVEEVQDIDPTLRANTQRAIDQQSFIQKQLLSEDHYKQKFLRVWKQVKLRFFSHQRVYHSAYHAQLESSDWKEYERLKIIRHRQSEIANNDLHSYSDLLLRNKTSLRKLWQWELIGTFFLLMGLITMLVLPNSLKTAFNQQTLNSILVMTNRLYYGILVLGVLGLIAISVPYFLLLTFWFVGINQAVQSKNFHYFFLGVLVFCIFVILVNLGLNIAYFGFSWNLWIPS